MFFVFVFWRDKSKKGREKKNRRRKKERKEKEKNSHVLLSSVPSATSCNGRFSNRSTFQGRGPRALARAMAVERPPGPPPTTTARRGAADVALAEFDAETLIDRIEVFS